MAYALSVTQSASILVRLSFCLSLFLKQRINILVLKDQIEITHIVIIFFIHINMTD